MNDLVRYQHLTGGIMDYNPSVVGEVIEHYNAENLYVRSMKLPANRVIVSHVHKYSTVHFMLEGEVIVFNTGGGHTRLKAPAIFECKAGVRRAGYTLRPMWYATAHGTGHIPDWIPVTPRMNDKMIKRMISCLTEEEYRLFIETRSQNGQIQNLRT